MAEKQAPSVAQRLASKLFNEMGDKTLWDAEKRRPIGDLAGETVTIERFDVYKLRKYKSPLTLIKVKDQDEVFHTWSDVIGEKMQALKEALKEEIPWPPQKSLDLEAEVLAVESEAGNTYFDIRFPDMST